MTAATENYYVRTPFPVKGPPPRPPATSTDPFDIVCLLPAVERKGSGRRKGRKEERGGREGGREGMREGMKMGGREKSLS